MAFTTVAQHAGDIPIGTLTAIEPPVAAAAAANADAISESSGASGADAMRRVRPPDSARPTISSSQVVPAVLR